MAPGSDGTHLDRRVRLVLGDQLPRWHEARDLTAAWVGRLKLHLALVRRPRSGTYRKAEPRIPRSVGDSCCPWLPVTSATVADPARTEGSTRPVAALHLL